MQFVRVSHLDWEEKDLWIIIGVVKPINPPSCKLFYDRYQEFFFPYLEIREKKCALLGDLDVNAINVGNCLIQILVDIVWRIYT